ENIEEAVLVGTHEHLSYLAVDAEFGDHRFGAAVQIETFVRHVLIMPDQLAGLGPERQNAGCVEAVEPAAIGRVVGLGIAGAPIEAGQRGVIGGLLSPAPPPPYFHASGISLGQVSEPGSPGAGMVYRRHSFLPVSGSQPSRKPRVVRSPPAIPVITTPFATRGASVAISATGSDAVRPLAVS